MKSFKKMLHKSLLWIFNHKSTLKIIEDVFINLMENPKTRKIILKALERALIVYATKTGYKI